MIRRSKKTIPGTTESAYDFQSIESVAEFNSCVDGVDVIFAIPVGDEGHAAIVYGSAKVRAVAESGKPRALKIAGFVLNFQSDQLEHLLAAVCAEKGEYEWNGDTVTRDDKPTEAKPTRLTLGGSDTPSGRWGFGPRGQG